jgi:hypothetical protein
MKNITKSILIVSLSSFLFLGGCGDYLDINDDPNNPTSAPIQGLLANATFETSQNTYRMGSFTSYYVQYLASPNTGSSTDTQEALSFGDQWFRLYDVMTDLSDLELLSEEEGATQVLGIAKILKAYNLSLLVDAWGDAPYSEAFFAETLNPSYDAQSTLYNEIFTLLNDGMTALQAANSTIVAGSEDFIYNGDTAKWLQFGNMLQARFLNRFTKQASYDPSAVLASVDQGFASNDDDAQVNYFDSQVNPWASVAISNAGLILGGWISEQTVEHLDGTTYGVVDPRIGFLMGTTDDDEYVGVENGAGRGNAPAAGAFSVLTTDNFYSARTAPLVIASFAEQKFIEAEAALRLTPADPVRAYQAYLDGIEAHMDKIGVDEADKNDYLTDPSVAVGSGSLTIDDVMREKYIALFLSPETWNDARRYDYGYADMTVPANLNTDLNGNFIRRLVYPDSEEQRNGNNVPSVNLLDRIVWDSN